MNIKLTDYNKCKDKNIIKRIYLNSFSKEERFPFWLLVKCSKEDNVSFNVVYDNNVVIGFQYIINYDDISYLMYFAIDSNSRNKGYGSEILNQLTKQNKNILLSIEKVLSEEDITYKRKQFYLRNGFVGTNKYIVDNNVEYELLCNNSNLNITKEKLEKIYTIMTSSKILKFIINKGGSNENRRRYR